MVLTIIFRWSAGMTDVQGAFLSRNFKDTSLDDMKYEKSAADPCLYFCWNVRRLIIWLSWIDECVVVGNEEGVLSAK
jgi:hypothetical protein